MVFFSKACGITSTTAIKPLSQIKRRLLGRRKQYYNCSIAFGHAASHATFDMTQFDPVEPTSQNLSVWVVEDNDEYRQVLVDGLRLELHCIVRAFSSTEEALLEGRKSVGADVILLDINFSGMSGIAAIPHFKATLPSSKIVMLTINDEEENIRRAMERGADGYVLKSAGLSEVARAIQAIRSGKKHMDPDALWIFLEGISADTQVLNEVPLSPREIEVLRRVAAGDSRISIARYLGISVGTVIAHQRAIHQKLGVNKSTEAVAKALRQRLL